MLAWEWKEKSGLAWFANEDGGRDMSGRHTADPSRVGGVVESARAILPGLDPVHEMGFPLALGKSFPRGQ